MAIPPVSGHIMPPYGRFPPPNLQPVGPPYAFATKPPLHPVTAFMDDSYAASSVPPKKVRMIFFLEEFSTFHEFWLIMWFPGSCT